MQFVDDERHLLGGGNQQRGETDGGGIDFDGFGDDRLGRDLLAKVDDGVAVVGKDGLDQVLADVMHIAIDGGNDDRALGHTFHFFEVVLQMGDGLLHHFGGLEHEGQDQFARAEFVADFLHGGEQDVVEGMNGGLMPGGKIAAVDDLINIRFDAFLVAVDDLPVQALFGGHAFGGIGEGRLRMLA